MKQSYILCLVGKDAPRDSSEWEFSYTVFRVSQSPHLSGNNTNIYTQFYLKSEDPSWSYIAVKGFDNELLSEIKEKYLKQQQHPLIAVAETDPPIDYLLRLREYVMKNGKDSILNLDLDKKEIDWQPTNLDNEKDIESVIIDLLEKEPSIIIQGPPGTGKTFLVANLCKYYLKKDYSIAVTALTNKALMEIATKEGLKSSIEERKVYKTNLSSDELKKIQSLQSVKSFTPLNGELLLTTYYKLSQFHSELIEGSKRFDLLVIEEASQSYLASISMFSSIARKVLVIGDHKQLMPVVKKRDQAYKIHEKIDGIIDGLKTYAINNNHVSVRFTKTWRLTSDASRLTGLYYDNKLISISEREGMIKFESKYRNLFHFNGSTSIVRLPSSMAGFNETDIIRLLCKVAIDLMDKNNKLEIALLSPYVNIESAFYEQFSKLSSDYSRITINTIHKIQGLTSDITIHYIPLRNPAFDLDDNLFNVATSRAKMGTLLVTFDHIRLVSNVSNETLSFIEACQNVTNIFQNFLIEK